MYYEKLCIHTQINVTCLIIEVFSKARGFKVLIIFLNLLSVDTLFFAVFAIIILFLC